MVSTELVSDGSIDLEFIHGTENPAVRGIELVIAGPQPNVLAVAPGALDFGAVLFS